MNRIGASAAIALWTMIALPDFTSREGSAEVDGRQQPVQYCIRATPSPEAMVGTVLRFVGKCPLGWLHANGQYIVGELYPDLFAVLQSFAPETRSSAQ